MTASWQDSYGTVSSVIGGFDGQLKWPHAGMQFPNCKKFADRGRFHYVRGSSRQLQYITPQSELEEGQKSRRR